MAARDASYLLLGLFVTLFTCGVWANIEVNMEDRVEVVRGETARITCLFNSSEGVGGMMIQWSYVTRTKEKQRIFYKDATITVIDKGTPFTERISVNGTGATGEVVLTINDVKLQDELEFICLIKGLTVGTGEGRTKLKVFESPDLPSIEEVQTGISINEEEPSKVGTCEVKNGFPKPNITWYRNNTPLQNVPDLVDVRHSVTTESTGLFSVKTDLILKVMKQHKDDTFYCEVTYFVPGGTRMTETKRIKIPVFYPPTAVRLWVESPKGKIKEGDNIELHCMDNGHPPSSYISIRHVEGQEETVENSIMRLPNVTRQHNGLYECTSTDTDTFESISGNTTVSVNYLDEVVIRPQDTLVVDKGKEVTATCNALSSLPTQTVWTKNGEKVSESHTLAVKDASFDDTGNYECKVNVPEIEGMEVSGSLILIIAGSPEILKPDTTEIISNEATVDLTCLVRGFPTPEVTWTTSDGQDLKYSQETTEEGEQSKVSIQLDSDITAFCNASNKYGTDSVTFNITTTVNTTPAPVTTTATTTTTTATTTATTTVTSHTISSPTDKPKETNSNSKEKLQKESRGVIIAVIIICILLLAVLGSVLYFLYKRGKICGRSGKQDLTKEKSSKDNIVVEMKSENTEEAVLLGVNGEKQPPNDQ